MLISTTFPFASAKHYLCFSCHLKLQMPTFVTCYFNNLSKYNAHIIVTELGYDEQTIIVTPISDEKFISFSNYINSNFTIRFIDTIFRFMASNLSTFAPNLITPNLKYFQKTAKAISTSTENLPLVMQKGIFCYEFTNSLEKLDVISLPPKGEIYSTLNETKITYETYQHVEDV